MQLRIERRAEIAMRSLQKIEQKQIDRALKELITLDKPTLSQNPKLILHPSGILSRKIYVYRGSPKLRLVITFDGDTCVIEDVVDHDRLDRLLKRVSQE